MIKLYRLLQISLWNSMIAKTTVLKSPIHKEHLASNFYWITWTPTFDFFWFPRLWIFHFFFLPKRKFIRAGVKFQPDAQIVAFGTDFRNLFSLFDVIKRLLNYKAFEALQYFRSTSTGFYCHITRSSVF